jgi:S1-C subfamily serine protease
MGKRRDVSGARSGRCLVPFALIIALGAAPAGAGAAGGELAAVEKKESFQGVNDIVRALERWVVAIEVEREEDLPLPRARIERRRLSPEAREYFQRPAGYVSGVLADREGHILTSGYNVAGKLKSLRVRLPGGQELGARLLARNELDDLALLRLEEPLPDAESWSDPPWAEDDPKPGRILLALGRSPDPRAVTVTEGIVSATSRNGSRGLQTDAKLNYGNVGGPLVDLDGRIVAISGFVGHTQPQWGLNSGIGFGTKAATILEVLEPMKRGEAIRPPERAFLGVGSEPDAAEVEGAPVTSVEPGSAAAEAGVLVKDVIVELEGVPVLHFAHLRRLIHLRRVGETITLKVRRGEELLELKATLGRRPQRS